MIWTDPETHNEYSYTWGYDHIKPKFTFKDLFGVPEITYEETNENKEKENKDMTTHQFLNIAAKYGDKATMEVGGSTVSVKIKTIDQNPNGTILKCELLRNLPYDKMYRNPIPSIKDVIFNDPATIVFWSDNTKTVIKCGENDWYDPEKGLAMAIAKKALGNQGNYYTEFRKWLKDYEVKPESASNIIFRNFVEMLLPTNVKTPKDLSDDHFTFCPGDFKPEDSHKVYENDSTEPKMTNPEKKSKWEIHYRNINPMAELAGDGEPRVYSFKYSTKYSAERAARRMYGSPDMGDIRWFVKEEV